jgi:hypothetical protein
LRVFLGVVGDNGSAPYKIGQGIPAPGISVGQVRRMKMGVAIHGLILTEGRYPVNAENGRGAFLKKR